MSMFLSEPKGSSQSSISPANPQASDQDVALMQRVLGAASSRPDLIPEKFMAYVVDFIQTSNLMIPIGQIFGFSQFMFQAAPTVGTNESTAAVYPSFVDLATVGPTLSGIPNGNYVFLFGCQAKNTVGDGALMGVSVNGSTPNNTTSAATNMTGYTQIMRASSAALSAGNNTVTAKYSAGSGGGTSNFSLRFLYALKYANL